MPAPKGHPKWGNPLKPRLYNPENLWIKALEYFQYIDENPYYINEQTKQKTVIPKDSGLKPDQIKEITNPIVKIPTERTYTLMGFCIFADMSHDTFLNYEKEETYIGVCKRIREIVEDNMLAGGLVGVYEKVLVARKLGLVEKHDITTDGESINAIIVDGRSKNV